MPLSSLSCCLPLFVTETYYWLEKGHCKGNRIAAPESQGKQRRSDDRRARGGGKTTFNFSNGNIGFYDLLLMITTRGRGYCLSVYVDLVTTGEPGAWCVSPGVSTCELSRAPESGPGLREAAPRGRDFSPGPGLSHVTRRGSRVREEAGRRQRYEQVSYNSLAVIQHQERRNPHLWQWLD